MKNKISYGLVALALFFSACSKDLMEPQEENQPDDPVILPKDLEGEYTVHSDGLAVVVMDGREEYVTRFKLMDDYGNTEYAYCANMEAPCYEGARYKSVPAGDYFKDGTETRIMAALTYIMNEYGWMETANPHGYRQMVQCVIWSLIHGYKVTTVNNAEVEIIMDAIHHIDDHIEDITNAYHTGVTMQGTDAAVKDGLFVNYGPYQVSENALLTDVDFLLTFDRDDHHAIFINDMGVEITQVKPEALFYVRVSESVSGDIHFTATASTSKKLWYINDFRFFVDVREGNYQQLFQPVVSQEAWVFFYSCSGSFTIRPIEPEPEPEPEKVIITGICWNVYGCGINGFTVNGMTLKSTRNYVWPVCFNMMVTKTPCKNGQTAIYTVTERIVTDNKGKYAKVYEIKVAFYADGKWKVYAGTITVDNHSGNHTNQQIELDRIQ